MIEVEKKFILSQNDVKQITSGADFLGEKTFTDIYFDTGEYDLTKNDMWLRKRGNVFELKIPMGGVGSNWETQQYQEIEGEDKIREVFALPQIKSFEEDIWDFGYTSFCQCITTRKKFQKEGFGIDLDLVSYGDFQYSLAEIELMIEDKAEMPQAIKKIEDFAISHGLAITTVRGKVLEYLARKKPEHYQALIVAGVVKE
jgi:adenylate cyclase class IV